MLRKAILLALLCLFIFTENPLQAKSHLHSLPPDTQDDFALLKRIVDNPNLLNSKYLECYVGPKASAMLAPSSQSLRSPAPVTRTFWLDKEDKLTRYTFEQSVPSLEKFLAEFSFSTTLQEDVIVQDLQKILNKDPSHVIDENAQPALMYSMSPNIKVFAYQDAHVVNVSRVAVQYAGPPLSALSAADLKVAQEHRLKVAEKHTQKGQHSKASSLLRSHLSGDPKDAQAHLKLAESYRAQSCVNEAISEYKAALLTCGNDQDIHDRCLAGLHDLKVDLPNNVAGPTTSVKPAATININPANSAPSANSTTPTPKPLNVGF